MKEITLLLMVLMTASNIQAQQTDSILNRCEQPKLTLGADLVSSYIFRGTYLGGASLQPFVNLAWKGLKFETWGSTSFVKTEKEIDLSLSYTLCNFKLGAIDYWVADQNAEPIQTYSKCHVLEGFLGYTFQKIPLSLHWNTVVLGEEKNNKGKLPFSTYIEAAYTHLFSGFNWKAACGFSPWDNTLIKSEGFVFNSLSLGVRKPFEIGKISLNLATTFIYNPDIKDAYFVLGVGLVSL